jgi:hypothetical protein
LDSSKSPLIPILEKEREREREGERERGRERESRERARKREYYLSMASSKSPLIPILKAKVVGSTPKAAATYHVRVRVRVGIVVGV